MDQVTLDAERTLWKQHWLGSAERVFEWSGFYRSKFEEIPNEYCGPSCCAHRVWLLVTTPRGVFKFGWRKRVMVLDWSRTDIPVQSEEFFKDQEVTKFDKAIHCWGYADAIDYLRRLRKVPINGNNNA